jgi:hypothetical protein
MAFGTTEADLTAMRAGAGGANDADFLVVGRVDAAVDNLGPKVFPIREFLLGVWVMEKSMSPYGAQDAGSRSREPAPAGLKGPTLVRLVIGLPELVSCVDSRSIWNHVLPKLLNTCIILCL